MTNSTLVLLRPPASTRNDLRFDGHERRYHDLATNQLPLTESLHDTIIRTLPYWHQEVGPAIEAGKTVLTKKQATKPTAL